MTITIDVPESLMAKIEAFAIEDGASVSQWVRDAVERQALLRRMDTAHAEWGAPGERHTDEGVSRIVS
jgi:hypothetical protein